MTTRNTIAFAIIALSVVAWFPGVYMDALTVEVGKDINIMGLFKLGHPIRTETRSVITTIGELFRKDKVLVALLITLFSIVVPVAKTIGLVLAYQYRQQKLGKTLQKIVNAIAKWAMADVFVVSIFLANLAFGGHEYTDAHLEPGFYFFLAYCILSIAGGQLLDLSVKTQEPSVEKVAESKPLEQKGIAFNPIGTVKNARTEPIDDAWGGIVSEIVLADHIPAEAIENIEHFSHLEVIYYFNKVENKDIVFAGHPRGNPDFPKMGILAQRKKDRPNAIGLCTVELVGRTERSLMVKYLDAIDGTPVLDIKPVFREFQVKGDVKQPAWVGALMGKYW